MKNSPLHNACIGGDADTVRLLLEKGADVNKRDWWGETPLHDACTHSRTGIAKLLISRGAEMDAKSKMLCTPLHIACLKGRPAIVRLLLEAGVDINVKGRRGETPLDLAMALPLDNPHREEILDLFRQYAPEAVVEAYCSPGPGGVRIG